MFLARHEASLESQYLKYHIDVWGVHVTVNSSYAMYFVALCPEWIYSIYWYHILSWDYPPECPPPSFGSISCISAFIITGCPDGSTDCCCWQNSGRVSYCTSETTSFNLCSSKPRLLVGELWVLIDDVQSYLNPCFLTVHFMVRSKSRPLHSFHLGLPETIYHIAGKFGVQKTWQIARNRREN